VTSVPAIWRLRATTGCIVVAAACLAAPATSAAPAAPAQTPTQTSLNNAGWTFAADPANTGVGRGWQRGDFKGVQVTLPHITDARTTRTAYQGGIGWYRATITAPKSNKGTAWVLRFAQVRRIADVWLDGKKVGSHTGSYEPFELPVTELADGKPHTLVIRTNNRLQPGRRIDGWWNWGGITRAVSLIPRGALAISNTGALPQRTCDTGGGNCRWTVLVDTTIANNGNRSLRPTVSATLTGPDGKSAGSASVPTRPLVPGETARVRFRVPVTGTAQLWSTTTPNLYEASVAATANGGIGTPAVETTTLGLRSVRVIDGIIYLNGKPIELRGASIHEDVPGRGPALSDRNVEQIVGHLKAIGANVTRAHYALDPRLLDKLDRAGIMVWSQAPVYHRDNELDTEAGRAESLRVVQAAVMQTRNHPSVITHSVANELSTHPDTRPGTRRFLADARNLTTDLNPTLPTAVDVLSYPGLKRQESYGAFDMLGLNTYFGWYPGRAGHSTAELSTLKPFVKGMRAWYPNTALVMTEFGAEATTNGPANEKQTYAFQQRYIRETLNLASSLPELSGAIYWTLQEFAVKPDWDGGAQRVASQRDAFHHKGVLTHDGRKKPGWDALRSDINATPLERSSREVALATGIPQPTGQRGRLGLTATMIILIAALALLAMDVIAMLAWRRHAHADEDELIAAALALPVPAAPALSVIAGGGEDDGRGERVA
jgi:beta-glucuronidase